MVESANGVHRAGGKGGKAGESALKKKRLTAPSYHKITSKSKVPSW